MRICCEYINQEYRVNLRYSGRTRLKVDTGSPVTIIDLNTLSTLLKCDINLLGDWALSHADLERVFVSYTGNNIKTIPCKLRNVYLDDVWHDSLYFFLNTSSQVFTPLLGMDYISRCKIEGNPKQALVLDKILDDVPYDNIEYIELDEIHNANCLEFDSAMDIMSGK